MKKSMYSIVLFLLLVGAFLTGTRHGREAGGKPPASGAEKVLYYVDPMNPAHTSDKPGNAPCGMPMEPVYADEDAGGRGSRGPTMMLSPGSVKISPEKQQLIGVHVSRVEMASGIHGLRVLGRVTPDEKRLHRIKAAVDGWVHEVSPVTAGAQVEKGQVLATYSASDLFLSVQSYLFAIHSIDHLGKVGMESPAETSPATSNFQQRVERLQSLGMSPIQIEEIKRTREIPQGIKILAPASGFVLSRNILPEERFERNTEWYRIADLSRVWIQTDVFEREAECIKPGMKAHITLPNQGQSFHGMVSDILPQFDPATRTHKVRLEVDNPGFALRPDMFVDVTFLLNLPPALTAPADAVLESGLRKTVFIDVGNGTFEPRSVETGWRFGDRVQIVSGVMPGERIVVSGNFLMDSESRMKLAASGMHGTPGKDPACGMEVYSGPAKAAGLFVDHDGQRYHFCCEQCRKDFEQAPERYVKKQSREKQLERDDAWNKPGETGRGQVDPVCGVPVEENRAKESGLSASYQGKTYCFVNEDCKKRFEAEPQRYVLKGASEEVPVAAPSGADPSDQSSVPANKGSSTHGAHSGDPLLEPYASHGAQKEHMQHGGTHQ